jgi:uncharacterized protein YjiS (DUF1127 family)
MRRRLGDSTFAIVRSIVRLVGVWRERNRLRRQLDAMSERELQDIGICRADIANEIGRLQEIGICYANEIGGPFGGHDRKQKRRR